MQGIASILLVDDQEEFLEIADIILKMAGYQVITATNGTEALTILQTQPINLILADITMPGMNGYQLYKSVSQNPKWAFIPFIFLTAHTRADDIRYAKSLGVDDYLTKPVHPDDLLATVHGKLKRANQLTNRL